MGGFSEQAIGCRTTARRDGSRRPRDGLFDPPHELEPHSPPAQIDLINTCFPYFTEMVLIRKILIGIQSHNHRAVLITPFSGECDLRLSKLGCRRTYRAILAHKYRDAVGRVLISDIHGV